MQAMETKSKPARARRCEPSRPLRPYVKAADTASNGVLAQWRGVDVLAHITPEQRSAHEAQLVAMRCGLLRHPPTIFSELA